MAEEELEFEHRDLHWGNILIQTTNTKEIVYEVSGEKFKVKTDKILATIIDFSLSRLKTGSKDAAEDGGGETRETVIFNDLSKDPDLFKAKGDYQFDIYRSENG